MEFNANWNSFTNSNFYELEFLWTWILFLFEKEFLYITIFKQMVDCNFLSSFYLCIIKLIII